MSAACQYVPTSDTFLPGIISFLDCEARILGAQGYQALAAPGSAVSSLLTILLTILVALFGYRLLLGDTPTIRDGVLLAVKIGIVLALATVWPAYQVLIYDVVINAPGEIATDIAASSGLPGSAGDLSARLDGVDQGLRQLAIWGVGQPPVGPDGLFIDPQAAPPLFTGFDNFALGSARILFLIGVIASLAFVRLMAGLLLALGPVFVAFLLFEGTRGLFEGWLRGLIGLALAALGSAILLGIELSLIEPWLNDLLLQRAAGADIIGVPAQLMAIAVIFAMLLAGIIGVMTRMAMAWRLPAAGPRERYKRVEDQQPNRQATPSSNATNDVWLQGRTRAASVADAVTMTTRREALLATAQSVVAVSGPMVTASGTRQQSSSGPSVALGHSHRRRTSTRVSAGASRRDRRG